MATKRTPTKKAKAATKRKSKAPSKKATKTATKKTAKKRASSASSKKSAAKSETKSANKRVSKAPAKKAAKKSRRRKSVPSPSRPTVPAKPRAKRLVELSVAAAEPVTSSEPVVVAEPVTPEVREALKPPSVPGPTRTPSSRPPSYLEGVPQDRIELVTGLFQVFRGVAKDIKTLVSQAIVLIDEKQHPPKR